MNEALQGSALVPGTPAPSRQGLSAGVTALLQRKELAAEWQSIFSNQYFPNQEVTQGSEGSPMKDGRNVVTSPSLVHLLRG